MSMQTIAQLIGIRGLHGSIKRSIKKSFDLIKHQSKRLKNSSDDDKTYYQKLIDWCDQIGLLSEEHSFKRAWLRRKKLCFYGRTKESDFLPFLNDIQNSIQRLQVMKNDYQTIADQLLDNKIVNSRQSANSTQAVLDKWLHGGVMVRNSQYYVHKSRLYKLGIDISIPHDVSKLPPQIRSNVMVDVMPVTPPDWYRMPKVQQLSLVA